MPQKSRKQKLRRSQLTRRSPVDNKVTPPAPLIQATTGAPRQAPAPKAMAADQIIASHQYIREDLKRIFITGGCILILLVILFFVLT